MVPDMARPKYKKEYHQAWNCVEEMLCGEEEWSTLKVNIF